MEREISKVMRKVAKSIASDETKSVSVTRQKLDDYLGPQKFIATSAEKKHKPGLATGLAWTQVGGDIIHIEVAIRYA